MDITQLRAGFAIDPVIATADVRMAYRAITPTDALEARALLAQQQQQQRIAQAEARAANEQIAGFNATLAGLGGSPMSYQSAAPVDPSAIPNAMFLNAVDQVGTYRGQPAPSPVAFRQRAMEIALGKVDALTALRLLSADDPVASAAMPMLAQYLGPSPLAQFQWYRDLEGWVNQSGLGAFFRQYDSTTQARNALGMMARTAAVLAVPLGDLFLLYAGLVANPQGVTLAYEAAMREAAMLRDEENFVASREVAWAAVELAQRRTFAAVFDALELLLALPVVPSDRARIDAVLAQLRPRAASAGGDVARRFARLEGMASSPAAPATKAPPPPPPPRANNMSTPLKALIERRQAAADRHDALRERYRGVPRMRTPEFAQAMRPIVDELASIAAAMIELVDVPPVEIARSLMWQGDALFDLSQGGHEPPSAGVGVYKLAEPYVTRARDPVMDAKFDGNYANMLMRMDSDPPSLREAIRRYESALRTETGGSATYRTELARARDLLAKFGQLDDELAKRRDEARELLEKLGNYAISAEASAAIAQQLREIATIQPGASLGDALRVLQRAQAAFEQVMRSAAPARTPGRPGLLAGELMRLWAQLAGAAMTATIDTVTRNRMFETLRALVEVSNAVRNSDDRRCVEIERLQARSVAATARQLFVREHVTWLEPRWPAEPAVEIDNTVHVCGTQHREDLEKVCTERGLTISESVPGREVGEARFESLRRAVVVVVFLDGTPIERASACYEAGIALALGKQLVVVSLDPLPFDVDVEPISTTSELATALDVATIGRQRGATPARLDDQVVAARAAFPSQAVLLQQLAARCEEPLAFAAVLDSILRFERGRRTSIVAYPAWPRRHAEVSANRVFHVMPFRADWSDTLKQRARGACDGATYRRHDDVTDPHIIRSLWDELTLANRAIVDLTGFNLNVALELGILDALGTPTLLVAQPNTVQTLFPMIKRTRVTEYTLADDTFERAVRQFVQRR